MVGMIMHGNRIKGLSGGNLRPSYMEASIPRKSRSKMTRRK